jgi:hypothetical protein
MLLRLQLKLALPTVRRLLEVLQNLFGLLPSSSCGEVDPSVPKRQGLEHVGITVPGRVVNCIF